MDSKSEVVKKELTVNGVTIKVIKRNSSTKSMLEQGIITQNDAEMDRRAKAAVNIEKRKAKVCKKPLALYDKKNKEAYLLSSEGKRITLG